MAAGYLKHAFDPKLTRRVALETCKVMQYVDADIVVVRGLSGSLIASAMSTLFGIPFAVVRKPGETSHSLAAIEIAGDWPRYDNWIIVDDFIATGHTVEEIGRAVKERKNDFGEIQGRCVGIVLYGSRRRKYENWDINGKQVQIYPIDVGDDED